MSNKRKRYVRPVPGEESSDSDIQSRTRHRRINYEESEFDSEESGSGLSDSGKAIKREKYEAQKLMVNLPISQELARKLSSHNDSDEPSTNGGDSAAFANGNENGNEPVKSDGEDEDDEDDLIPRAMRRGTARKKPKRSSVAQDDEESEFEMSDNESNLSDVPEDLASDTGFIDNDDDDFADKPRRRKKKLRHGTKPIRQKKKPRLHSDSDNSYSDHDEEDEAEEEGNLSEELRDLNDFDSELTPRKHLRARKSVNYQILPPPPIEDFQPTPDRRTKSSAANKRLFPTVGPFGGSEIVSLFGNPGGMPIGGGMGKPDNVLGNDSDDSDDDLLNKSKTLGTPGAGFGKVGKKPPADSDPLGVDMNIDFSAVGGLDSYIDQLKEMVSLPMQYPELYKNFGIVPPRGVLFHGPPGTGKTLMARALAASCSSGGKKITFFMRKGADCLSKWVGEAERQLRLLFEEARNQQPSIIFFDEIDGLAPVRSSKQEQIHASIVSTLLALMDGMDNRGQVIVIGATNRPDSVDPALRRPGRFDREFYFPLPDLDARKKIISINTRKWDPPLKDDFIEKIARLTKGYGGADLRALCTESALNAIQRRYPQIYKSEKKLKVNPTSVHVGASDFMKSVDKIIPSSARSAASGAQPLPARIEPLLRASLDKITAKLDHLFPKKKKMTALEDAMYEDFDDADGGFQRQEAMREFQRSRVFRPRLLVFGEPGMGQQYITSAIQHHLEGFHIQSFDVATLISDSTRTPEAAIAQLMVEVKRHTPSVIFVPNIDQWFYTMNEAGKSTFTGILRSIQPTDPILVLGMAECEYSELSPEIKHLFGYSTENRQGLEFPTRDALEQFFEKLFVYLRSKPSDYPEPDQRPLRKLEQLEVVEESAMEGPMTKADERTQIKKDIQLKNMLKIRLNATMEALKVRYKKFKKPPIDESKLLHLYDPVLEIGDPAALIQNAYKKTEDNMILEVMTGKKYYNMDLDVIEERLWNGYYCEPKQLLKDVELMVQDAAVLDDRDRKIKSQEMLTNVQVWIDEVINADLMFAEQCREMHKRQQEREKKYLEEHEREKKELEDQAKLRATEQQANENAEQENGTANGAIQELPVESRDVEMAEVPDGGIETTVTVVEPVAIGTVDVAPPAPGLLHPVRTRVPVIPPVSEIDPAPLPQPQPQRQPSPKPTEFHPARELTSPPPSEPQEPQEPQEPPKPREPEREISIDESRVVEFKQQLFESTKDLVVEDLEQIFSALVDTIWTRRGEWDRTLIINELESTLSGVTDVMQRARKALAEDWKNQ